MPSTGPTRHSIQLNRQYLRPLTQSPIPPLASPILHSKQIGAVHLHTQEHILTQASPWASAPHHSSTHIPQQQATGVQKMQVQILLMTDIINNYCDTHIHGLFHFYFDISQKRLFNDTLFDLQKNESDYY
jgi:hypothetical protein